MAINLTVRQRRFAWLLDRRLLLAFGGGTRRWREANPEDTLRFYALRLHEVEMIETNPNKLIAEGTDWRFLNELKRALRA